MTLTHVVRKFLPFWFSFIPSDYIKEMEVYFSHLSNPAIPSFNNERAGLGQLYVLLGNCMPLWINNNADLYLFWQLLLQHVLPKIGLQSYFLSKFQSKNEIMVHRWYKHRTKRIKVIPKSQSLGKTELRHVTEFSHWVQ